MMVSVESAIAVVAIIVAYLDQAGGDKMIREIIEQPLPCLFDIFRQTNFREIELIGSIDQLYRTIQVRRDIVFEFDGHIA